MGYIVSGVIIIYAALCIAAAGAQMKTAEKKDTPALMAAGGLLLFAAAIAKIFWAAKGVGTLSESAPAPLGALWTYGWAVVLAGGALICIAAFLNGKRGGHFHASHHIIRLALTLILAAGYYLS